MNEDWLDISLTLYTARCELATAEDVFDDTKNASTTLLGVRHVISLLEEAAEALVGMITE